MDREPPDLFDVFLSHSHEDATIVEELGRVLSDREEHFRVWLDRWVLIPGDHWQQDMARGLDKQGHVRFVSEKTRRGGG